MSFYSELAETATALLTEFGAPGQLFRAAGPGTYDPTSGSTSDPEADGEDLIAAVFEYDEALIDGSLIQRGDKLVYISVAGLLEPKDTDTFAWPIGVDGAPTETFTVIKNQKIAPAGINVLYQLQVRK